MNESDALALALDAYARLESIDARTGEISDALQDLLTAGVAEVDASGSVELASVGDDAATEAVYTVHVDNMPDLSDLMAFQWCSLMVSVVLLAALLLNLGANLYQCFNRHMY